MTSITIYPTLELRNGMHHLIAMNYRCGTCEKVWQHPSLAAIQKAKTSAWMDTECKKHWAVCLGRD